MVKRASHFKRNSNSDRSCLKNVSQFLKDVGNKESSGSLSTPTFGFLNKLSGHFDKEAVKNEELMTIQRLMYYRMGY